MSKIKDFFKVMTWKQIIALIILAAADVFVIAAPYYIKGLIPNLHNYLNIKENDVATLTSIIGYVTLITQLPGGFLANKFSSRWLLFLAVLSTGIITFWFGGIILESQNYTHSQLMFQYGMIFGLWGISSTLIFWTPLWKLVSQQTTKENQGFAYGLQGTANGVIGLLLVFLVGMLITNLWSPQVKETAQRTLPFAVYAFWIAAMLTITSFLVLFLVPEKRLQKSGEKITWNLFVKNLKQIGKSMLNWKLWLLSLFVMGMYTFQSVFAYYLLQMLNNAFLAPVILGTVLAGIRTYAMRSAVSSFAGKFADKFKSYLLLLLLVTFIGIIIILVLILLPFAQKNQGTRSIWLVVIASILYLVVGFLSWIMVTLRYVQIGEIEIEKNSYASSIGILSFIGFSPDAWLYQITGEVGSKYTFGIEKNTSLQGYQIILAIALSITLVGLIAGIIVHIANTIELKKLGKTNYRWRTLENV